MFLLSKLYSSEYGIYCLLLYILLLYMFLLETYTIIKIKNDIFNRYIYILLLYIYNSIRNIYNITIAAKTVAPTLTLFDPSRTSRFQEKHSSLTYAFNSCLPHIMLLSVIFKPSSSRLLISFTLFTFPSAFCWIFLL